MHRGCFAVGILLSTLGLATSAAGQEGSDDPRIAEARRIFEEGREHFEDERFRLAADAFERAHGLLAEAGSPMAGTILYNLATSLDELPGRHRDARDTYARFLAEASRDDPRVQALVHTVEQRIRELDLRLQEEEQQGDQGEDALEGSTDQVVPPAPDGGGGSMSPIGPIVLGAGGALLVTGAIVGVVSLGQAGDFEEACPELSGCSRELQSDYDAMRTTSVAADVLMVTGLAAAAAGAVLTFTLRTGSEEAPAVSGFCDDHGCHAVARGRF